MASGRALGPAPVHAAGRRLGRVLCSVLTGAIILGPFALAGAAEPDCSDLTPKEWVTIPVPAFPSGDQAITDYAVSPTDPRLLFVTNGRSVLSSTDGGCSFEQSFDIETADLSYETDGASIKDLHLGSTDGTRAYLVLEARNVVAVATVTQDLGPVPRVLVTTDGGATWEEGDGGLEEAAGSPLSLASTPDSQKIYLLVDENEVKHGDLLNLKTPQRLYVSTDGGLSWAVQNQFGSDVAVEPGLPSEGPFMERIQSDPVVENALWLFGRDGLLRSADGGETMVVFDPDPFAALDIIRDPLDFDGTAPSPVLIAYREGVPTGLYSPDGVNVTPIQEIDAVRSVALARPGRFAFATTQGDVYYRHRETPDPIDISVGGRSLTALESVTYQGSDIIYARTLTTLLRRVAPPPPVPETWEPPPLPVSVQDPVEIFPSLATIEKPRFEPDRTEVVLEPGETRDVEHHLLLPGSRKVDVVYLMDVSSSMGEELNGLRQSASRINRELSEQKIDAHFGLGIFRAYGSAVTYERLLNVTAPGPELAGALNSLAPSGGGPNKTHLASLYQLATGAGQTDAGGAFIAANQQMDFREDALRIVVHGTDEAFVDRPPSPSFASAAGALTSIRAHQVGLAYENEFDPLATTSGSPTEDLQEMARATDAIAPAGGVDCGGGVVIPAGASMVCVIASAQADDLTDSIGTAIVRLVLGLEDKRNIGLEVTGDTEALVGVTPEVHKLVDFKEKHALPFTTTVRCRGSSRGTHDMTLTAVARGVELASAELSVVCSPFLPPAPELAPPAAALLVPPPGRPPPPPQPMQVQSPVQQVQAQTQSQSQAQAQVGLVAQRQAQPQVAAVKVMKPSANLSRVGAEGSDDLAFSRYSSKKHGNLPPYLGSYIAAAALGGAFGALVRVRARRVYVTARTGSRRRTDLRRRP